MKLAVKGFSIINHGVRDKLELGVDSYIFLDFIDGWNKKESGGITYADYYKNIALNHFEVDGLLLVLGKNNFIVWDKGKGRIDVSGKWKAEFDVDGKVDELWKIHSAGTKTKCRQRLPNVLKQIDFEELKNKLVEYVKACKEKESFPKNLDTWLNPKDKHWDAVVINRKKEVKKEVKTTVTFKK